MLEMRRRGMTYRQIGDRFGLSWSSVAKRLGCKGNQPDALSPTV
jgi:hypothetical protein